MGECLMGVTIVTFQVYEILVRVLQESPSRL